MPNENHNGGRRLASAATNIARGAASGGLHGAALGALREFAPEIIKTVGMILIILIVLPMVTFAAIPNVLFGFGSSIKAEIAEFTTMADALNSEYNAVDTYEESIAERIIASILALFTSESDEETGAAYDEIEITRNLENLTKPWLIAIASVANNQDLFAMNSGAVERMTSLKMESKWEILSETIGEGEELSVFRLLKIDIYDISPTALMDKLNFTDEQRNWAALLYSTLEQEQSLSLAYGDAYYGTDYGDIVLTDAAVDVVYYNQTDSRWGGELYGTRPIANVGCGPTALAIAVATFVDSAITPYDVATWGAGYYVQGSGSKHTLITEGCAHYGLTVTGLGQSAHKVADALGRGSLVIAIMAKGHFTDGGHFIVLRGITSDGMILVADPASVTRSNQEWSLKLITNEVNRGAGAGAPFWEVSL